MAASGRSTSAGRGRAALWRSATPLRPGQAPPIRKGPAAVFLLLTVALLLLAQSLGGDDAAPPTPAPSRRRKRPHIQRDLPEGWDAEVAKAGRQKDFQDWRRRTLIQTRGGNVTEGEVRRLRSGRDRWMKDNRTAVMNTHPDECPAGAPRCGLDWDAADAEHGLRLAGVVGQSQDAKHMRPFIGRHLDTLNGNHVRGLDKYDALLAQARFVKFHFCSEKCEKVEEPEQQAEGVDVKIDREEAEVEKREEAEAEKKEEAEAQKKEQ